MLLEELECLIDTQSGHFAHRFARNPNMVGFRTQSRAFASSTGHLIPISLQFFQTGFRRFRRKGLLEQIQQTNELWPTFTPVKKFLPLVCRPIFRWVRHVTPHGRAKVFHQCLLLVEGRFFEMLPNRNAILRDGNRPIWVHHLLIKTLNHSKSIAVRTGAVRTIEAERPRF